MQTQTNSTVLNLFLINEFKKQDAIRSRDQYQIIERIKYRDGKCKWSEDFLNKQINMSDDLPTVTIGPKKWANTSINHNLKEFLQHNDLPNSGNPFNDHSLFEHAPVLKEGWVYPDKKWWTEVNPGRKGPIGNMVHHAKFKHIFASVGFDKNSPICLDRNGRVLDGAYRIYTIASMNEDVFIGGERVYVKIYDFE